MNSNDNFWTVTGWGIDEDDLCPSVISQIDFMKKYLPEKYEMMQEECEVIDGPACDMSNTADYLDYCESWIENFTDDEGYSGFGAIFARAIQENEDGFYPEYFSCNGCSVIIYEDRLPWEMSERVKQMKAADMSAIFKKYLDDLGITAKIERQTVAFYS